MMTSSFHGFFFLFLIGILYASLCNLNPGRDQYLNVLKMISIYMNIDKEWVQRNGYHLGYRISEPTVNSAIGCVLLTCDYSLLERHISMCFSYSYR